MQVRGLATPPRERAIHIALMAGAGLTIVVSAGLLAVLVFESVRFFGDVAPSRLAADTVWAPAAGRFGLWPLLAGTLLTTLIGVGFALPLGVLAAIYVSELAPPRVRRLLVPALELLAGVPGVVLGYFALHALTPALAQSLGLSRLNALSAGLVIGVMLVPMIAVLGANAMQRVPLNLREAAYALGASRLTTILRVVLPTARRGIVAALLLATARGAGETMIVAIAAGHVPRLGFDATQPTATLTTFVLDVSMRTGATTAPNAAYRAAFVCGLLLVAVTIILNVLAQRALASRPAQAPR
ncbi:MAG: phosphate ABC transporter permease subunit PstC [Myxococcales bacterium]|nr:phosphate ABC transporter permease subunit PstC [Myxococcales bacterium]